MSQPAELTSAAVKELALEYGFARAGITHAGVHQGGEVLHQWLGCGWHADMTWMAENIQKRHHPALLVEGARSVICLAVSYAPADESNAPPSPTAAFVARYARGRNYHKLLKRRCHALMDRLRELEPSFAGRALVDTAPLAERTLAAAAGLGWIGKNGMLIVPALGSYVLLCEIVCNLPLEPDGPIADQCADCDACLRACPTGALAAGGLVDARKCLSYLTIEHHGEIANHLAGRFGTRVFGCDSCQAICPHNRSVPAGDDDLLGSRAPLGGADLEQIALWTHDQWDLATRGSATRRASCEMFRRNAQCALANNHP